MNTQLAELATRIEALEAIVRQQPVSADRLYTTAEVAERLRCGVSNVYNLMLAGELATTRVGAGNAGKRVRGSDLALFLDERTSGGPSPEGDFKHLGRYAGRRAC